MDLKKNKKIQAGAVLGAASTASLIGVGAALGYVCPFCLIGIMASGGMVTAGAVEEFMKKKLKKKNGPSSTSKYP
ncbi:MAG: hypothetical protein ABIF01_04145 [Candidatus Micrarchaeota archaeon]